LALWQDLGGDSIASSDVLRPEKQNKNRERISMFRREIDAKINDNSRADVGTKKKRNHQHRF
jgi:hypothetical protein